MSSFFTFKQFIAESSFREANKSLNSKVKSIVNTYNLVYKKLNKSDSKVFTTKIEPDSKWGEYFSDEKAKRLAQIDEIKIKDLKTKKIKLVKILVAYDAESSPIAHYDETNNFIVLFQDKIKYFSDAELEAVIIHELTHGNQEYKKTSEEYDAELKKMSKGKRYDKSVYFLEPIEFDAHLTELSYRIKEEYSKLLNAIKNSTLPETKKVFEKRQEKFLLEMKLFIKSDSASYLKFEELPLPKFFSTHQDFLVTIAEFPSYWKKLKQKMTGLYFTFTKEFP